MAGHSRGLRTHSKAPCAPVCEAAENIALPGNVELLDAAVEAPGAAVTISANAQVVGSSCSAMARLRSSLSECLKRVTVGCGVRHRCGHVAKGIETEGAQAE